METAHADGAANAGEAVCAFVDGHVHIYPDVGLSAVFAALRRNGALGSGRDRQPVPRTAVLILADPRGVGGFERLHRDAAAVSTVGWAIDDESPRDVRFRHEDGGAVVFVRGRQLVTHEGLEVLAAGIDRDDIDGRSLAATLDAIRAAGGWSTIAWGVGKWLGRRGRLVAEAVRSEAGSGDVVLGDNGGRPWFWSRVPQFDVARECGMHVLPGSDPLPVPGDESRIGSYGFEIDVPPIGDGAWAEALRSAVIDARNGVRPRGRRVGAMTFARNQLLIRTAGPTVDPTVDDRR